MQESVKGEELVFIQKDDVFTTSKIIAEELGVQHHAIQQTTDKYKSDFEDFGKLKVAFQLRASKTNQKEKIYLYNEQQATFLLTRVRSTKKVREFTKELVRRFFLMREELLKRRKIMPTFVETRRRLTDAIKRLPDSEHKQWKYKQYTDMIYTIVIGKTASQKRKELGLSEKTSINSFLTSEELEYATELESQMVSLVDMEFSYEQIKAGLIKLYEKIKMLKLEPQQCKLIGI